MNNNICEVFCVGIDDIPEWLIDLDKKNSIAIYKTKCKINSCIEFYKEYGSVFVYYGDFIIKDGDRIYPCSKDLFYEIFESV